MKKAIIGKKIGMTQIFDENGKVVPVTVVEAGPCVVVQKKTIEKDGNHLYASTNNSIPLARCYNGDIYSFLLNFIKEGTKVMRHSAKRKENFHQSLFN